MRWFLVPAIFNNLFYTILSCLIFLFSGLGLTILILPRGLKKYMLFLSPFVGYCYIVLAGWHLSTFGMKPLFNDKGQIKAVEATSSLNFHGTDSYFWLIFIPPIIFLIVSIYKNRGNIKETLGIDRSLFAPIIAGVISLILISIPLFKYDDGLSVVSTGNHDIIDSGLKSRFLKEFSFSDTQGYLSHLVDGHNFLKHDVMTNRFGTPFIAAFLSSVFSLEAYQFQMITMSVLFFFSVFLFYVLLREVFRYNQFPAFVITMLYGLSPIMYYLVYLGFQPQVVGMSLSVGFFFLQFYLIENSKKFLDYAVYIPILALLNWGISSSYAHMLPFLYIPIGAYIVVKAVKDRSFKDILNWMALQVLALVLTTILSPFRMKVLISNLLFHAGAEAGWNMPYFSPDYILGLNYASVLEPLTYVGYITKFKPLLGFWTDLSFINNLMHLVLSIPIIGLLYFGISKTFKDDRRLFYISATSLFIIILGYNYIYFFVKVSSKYKAFKLLSFFLPLALPTFLIALRNASIKSKGFISGYTLLFFLGANIISALIFVSSPARYIEDNLVEVKKVESMPEIESVNIIGGNYWEIMWENVFLMKKKQFFQISTYAGRSTDNIIDGAWDIFNIKEYMIPPWCMGDIKYINFTYALMRAHKLDKMAMVVEITLKDKINTLWAGQVINIPVKVKNVSGYDWPMECNLFRKLYLAYSWIKDAGHPVVPHGGVPILRTIKSGGEETMNLMLTAPPTPGRYILRINILQEINTWFYPSGDSTFVCDILPSNFSD